MKQTAIIILVLLTAVHDVVAEEDANPRLGKYSCIVQTAHPNNGWAKEYVGSRLEYDADKGILSLASPIEIDGESAWLPPQRISRSLTVQTYPSSENNLHAVQFDPVSDVNQRPFVAWLMIQTINNELRPSFKFFSTGIQGVVTGKCLHTSDLGL